MSYSKVQNHDDCPDDLTWAVVNDDDGEVEGCFDDEDLADSAIADLNASGDEDDTTEEASISGQFGAIASHSTGVDTDSAWDGGANETRMNNTEANNRRMYAWRDPEGDPAARASYRFPHHMVGQNGTPGVANSSAASSGIAVINGGRGGTSIPAADRKGVYDHLARHLRDADLEPPEFNGSLVADADVMEPGTPVVDGETDKSFDVPVMVIEGAWTGDRRYIDPGVLTWRDLPLPVMAITKTTQGHDDAELSGKLTDIERGDAAEHELLDSRTGEPYPDGTTFLKASGLFDTSEWATEIGRLVHEGFLRGISVDMSDVTSDIVFVDSDGNEVDDIDFFDWLFGPEDEEAEEAKDYGDLLPAEKIRAGRIMGLTICPFPAFEGAYITVPTGLAAGGYYITPVFDSETDHERWPSVRNLDLPFGRKATSLAASAAPIKPPAKWFGDPEFSAKVPSVNIDADGHIFGYIATWDECHTAFSGQCILAPHSYSGYSHYMLGGVLCDDESTVSTGVISMGTGHAELWMNADEARAHYDNTGTAMADVVCGEDDIGIWYTGSLVPDADDIAIRRLRGSVLSGDWRNRGGNLELVAVLAVNTPGFPVKRPMVRVASGMPQAMVAAGMVHRRKSTTGHSAVDDDYKERLAREALRNRVHH
jgi:hypothetical protein